MMPTPTWVIRWRRLHASQRLHAMWLLRGATRCSCNACSSSCAVAQSRLCYGQRRCLLSDQRKEGRHSKEMGLSVNRGGIDCYHSFSLSSSFFEDACSLRTSSFH